jgi:type I restriction enzyme, S subunit
MKFEKLGNIADIIAGQSPPSSTYNSEGKGIPFFQGKADYGEKYPSVRYWCTEPTKISLPDDILISMRAPVGPVNINIVKSCIGRGLSAIRVKKNVSRDFIYFWLKQNQHIIAAKETGSTFKAITQKILNEIVVPFPSYPDQLHIANLLSKAENLIAQRKESIRLLDEFLKSTFLEMFGDPNSNSNDYKSYQINDLKSGGNETFSNGPFGSDLLTSELTDNGVPVIYVRNIKNGSYIWKSNVFVTEAKADYLSNCQVFPDDVIIAKVGDPPGMSAVYPRALGRSIITQDVIRLRLNQKIVLPIYFSQFLNSEYGKNLFKKIIINGTRMRFALGSFKDLVVKVPPLSLQTQFAQIVEKAEALKTQYQQSLQELENLYGSLSQQAFRGELTITKAVSV